MQWLLVSLGKQLLLKKQTKSICSLVCQSRDSPTGQKVVVHPTANVNSWLTNEQNSVNVIYCLSKEKRLPLDRHGANDSKYFLFVCLLTTSLAFQFRWPFMWSHRQNIFIFISLSSYNYPFSNWTSVILNETASILITETDIANQSYIFKTLILTFWYTSKHIKLLQYFCY